jgi:sigma-B regulation protein RsbU (phosphoserine phosphatase)
LPEFTISWSGESHSLQLGDGEHSVGRAGDNALQVPAPRVSKHHAVLRIDGDRMFVRDLGSTNGTEVGGKRVGEAEVEVPQGTAVVFAGAVLRRAEERTTMLTSFVAPHQVSTALRHNVRDGYSAAARDRIMTISSELFELLASGDDSREVENAACKFVSKLLTADRVVLLTDQGEASSIEPSAIWTSKPNDGAPLQLSSTIVGHVISERDAVLVADPASDARFGEQKSIMALSLRSAMAAPLFDNERVRGILYVDTADPGIQYAKDDLQVLTATANAVAVKLRNLTLEKELSVAARIQKQMLPADVKPPEGYEVDAYQLMCRAVGGDLYAFEERPNGHLFFALGDVSGKGMPAALAMSAATVLIGMLAEIGEDLEQITSTLHRHLMKNFSAERFITLFAGELDPETGRLRYVNAGHEPPLVVRKDGKLESLASTTLPIAMLDEWEAAAAETVLEKGEVLMVLSDGVPEATTDGEKFLGIEPIQDIFLSRYADGLRAIRDAVVEAVEKHLDGDHTSDDVTVLLLRRVG